MTEVKTLVEALPRMLRRVLVPVALGVTIFGASIGEASQEWADEIRLSYRYSTMLGTRRWAVGTSKVEVCAFESSRHWMPLARQVQSKATSLPSPPTRPSMSGRTPVGGY